MGKLGSWKLRYFDVYFLSGHNSQLTKGNAKIIWLCAFGNLDTSLHIIITSKWMPGLILILRNMIRIRIIPIWTLVEPHIKTKQRFKNLQHLWHFAVGLFVKTWLNDLASFIVLKKYHKQINKAKMFLCGDTCEIGIRVAPTCLWICLTKCLPMRFVKSNSQIVKCSLLGSWNSWQNKFCNILNDTFPKDMHCFNRRCTKDSTHRISKNMFRRTKRTMEDLWRQPSCKQ